MIAPAREGTSSRLAARTEGQRLSHLDGLRGVAIALVVVFHTFARWPEHMPFGAAYAVQPVSTGWVGVELFFLISGFVIFMSLERSASLVAFAWNRWLRLFPAMAIATVLVLASAPLLPERPQPIRSVLDAIVGLTFIGPSWWLSAGLALEPIEGVFWSLFVEVQFYAVAALAYFVGGRRAALASLAGLYLVSLIGEMHLAQGWPVVTRLSAVVSEKLGAFHYIWFLAGALLYRHTVRSDARKFAAAGAALVVAIALSETHGHGVAGRLGLAAVAALFVGALVSPRVQAVLSHWTWQVLGFASYPLYLVHENLIVALTVKLSRAIPFVPSEAWAVVSVGVAIALGYAIARLAEPPLRRALKNLAGLVPDLAGTAAR